MANPIARALLLKTVEIIKANVAMIIRMGVEKVSGKLGENKLGEQIESMKK